MTSRRTASHGPRWSVQPLRGRGCRGKVRWPKRKQALTAVGMYRSKHPDDPGRINAYRCDECRGWHIGHG